MSRATMYKLLVAAIVIVAVLFVFKSAFHQGRA